MENNCHIFLTIICKRQDLPLLLHVEEKGEVLMNVRMWGVLCKVEDLIRITHILVNLKKCVFLYLRLSITNNTMNFISIQELDVSKKPIYFISKVFKVIELRYQKIKRLLLEVVKTVRKVKLHFPDRHIIIWANY